MEKKIQTTELNMEIKCTRHLVVDINSFRFVLDEEMPFWITILNCINGEDFEVVDEMDEESVIGIHTLEDLKRVALNWYFDNVEVVKSIDKIE